MDITNLSHIINKMNVFNIETGEKKAVINANKNHKIPTPKDLESWNKIKKFYKIPDLEEIDKVLSKIK